MESVLPLSACSFSSRALAATSNEFAVPVGLPMRGGDGHLKKAGLNAKKQLRESSAIMYGSQETNVLCGSAGSDVRKKNPYVLKSLGNISLLLRLFKDALKPSRTSSHEGQPQCITTSPGSWIFRQVQSAPCERE
mmetsp:Transcript_110667/g.214325  ORF Transcript_110667/g.214325 Transcript_110667/m.214325 type:complete len:135 (-) Transcript_110667:742-1146(-)